MKKFFIMIFALIVSLSCNGSGLSDKQNYNIMIDDSTYQIRYNNQMVTLKGVRSYLVLANTPYFNLFDGRILKGIQTIDSNSYNMQQYQDRIYYIKHYQEGGEWGASTLNILDTLGNLKIIRLRLPNKQPITPEWYGIRNSYYIFEIDLDRFCVTDTLLNNIQIYKWHSK